MQREQVFNYCYTSSGKTYYCIGQSVASIAYFSILLFYCRKTGPGPVLRVPVRASWMLWARVGFSHFAPHPMGEKSLVL